MSVHCHNQLKGCVSSITTRNAWNEWCALCGFSRDFEHKDIPEVYLWLHNCLKVWSNSILASTQYFFHNLSISSCYLRTIFQVEARLLSHLNSGIVPNAVTIPVRVKPRKFSARIHYSKCVGLFVMAETLTHHFSCHNLSSSISSSKDF